MIFHFCRVLWILEESGEPVNNLWGTRPNRLVVSDLYEKKAAALQLRPIGNGSVLKDGDPISKLLDGLDGGCLVVGVRADDHGGHFIFEVDGIFLYPR